MLVGATFRPPADAGDSSGVPFAEQLSGLTVVSPSAGAGRSVGPAPQTAPVTANVPAVAQPTLPYEIHFPNDGAGDSTGPHANTQKSERGAKRAIPQRQAVSDESTEAAPVAVSPVPAPQLTAMLPPATVAPVNTGEPANAVTAAVSRSEPGEPAEPAKPDLTAATGPVLQPREMAFAARVEPVQGVDRSALSSEMASAAAVASASKKVVAADNENAAPFAAPGLLAATTATGERNAEPAAPQSPAAASHPVETSAPLAESLPQASAPLKDISLQVTQPGKEPVDVRVVQAGSEVRVSVHSGDATLTSGLRQGLSELQSRLEENGYRSEMWRPGVSAAPLTPTASPQAPTNHSRGGDGQPQQNGSQQDGGRRNQNQSNQPRWVEELESSLTGGEKSSGGFYGFSS